MKNKLLSWLPIILLVLFGLFCSRGLFQYNIFATHDGDHHISRGFDAIQGLKEGHFPLRWAGSLNGGCGVPVFNFFYPLIYYLVFLINFAAKDVIFSLKIVCLLSFTVGPVFFYLWLKEETGNKIAGFAGAFLYLFVPYRLLLVFVRFSPEFVAYTVLPILLWSLGRLLYSLGTKGRINKNSWRWAFFSVFWGGVFVISHNFVVMLLLPIVVSYFFLKAFLLKLLTRKNFFLLTAVVISMILLGSFFLGPMLVEKKAVKLDTMKTVDFRDHFPTLGQVIRSRWDYGNSLPGTEKDGMSFMLGYAQWLVLGFSLIFVVLKLLNCQKKKEIFFSPVFFWLVVSLVALFLILPWSKFVWEKVEILQEIQFSWRFLGVAAFSLAALAGFLLAAIPRGLIFYFLSAFLVLLGMIGNRNHLRPQPSPYPWKYVDYEKNHDHRYATTTIFDDVLNKESRMLCLPGTPAIISSLPKGMIWSVERGNTYGKISLTAAKEEKVTLRLGLEFFPGIYQISLNGRRWDNLKNCQGRVCLPDLNFPAGENILEWKIVQSPTEVFFNRLSFLTLTAWTIVIFFVSLKKDEKKTRQADKS